MSKRIFHHMGISVRGALNWPKDMLKNAFDHDDGRPMTPDEAREVLMDELSKGHENLPVGDCDNWDWKKGCQGHKMEADDEDSG